MKSKITESQVGDMIYHVSDKYSCDSILFENKNGHKFAIVDLPEDVDEIRFVTVVYKKK